MTIYGDQGSAGLETYSTKYRFHKLERTDGVLQVTMQSDGGSIVYGRDDVHFEWGSLWNDISRDPQNRLVILTGTGGSFIDAHPPSWDWRDRADKYGGPVKYHPILDECLRHTRDLVNIPVPVIAAVNGPARIHAEVALFSDIVLATPETVIQDSPHLPEQVIPGDGINIAIAELLGRVRGSYFLYLGQRIDADEALRLGLINEIVDRARLLERAYEIAQIMLLQPDYNLRYTRMLMTHELKAKVHSLLGMGMALEGLANLSSDWKHWEMAPQRDWTADRHD